MFFLFERIPDYIKFKIKYNGYEQIYNDDCSVYTIKNKEEFTDYSFTFEVSVKKIENVIEYDVDGRLFYFKIDNEIDNFPEIIYSYKKINTFPNLLEDKYDVNIKNVIYKIKKINDNKIFIKEIGDEVITYYCEKLHE
jgi:hypothetical protein